MQFLHTHRPSMMLNTSKAKEISKTSTEVSIVHGVDDGVEDLKSIYMIRTYL